MFCDEVLDAVEPIAAGELTPNERIAAHLGSCRACAKSLDKARRVDALLRARPAPAAPQQFTSRTMARIRRARWRSEQIVDVGFNVVLGAAALVVLAGVWLLVSRAGLTIGGSSLDLASTSLLTLARRMTPSLPLYGGATALVITALGVWWWAERDAAL